jgi:hypothetical protein
MTGTQKECFGVLDKVFPMGDRGLREVVPACFHCPDKKECLQAALTTEDGLRFRSHVLDRGATSGLVGPLRRWSQRKTLHRLLKEKQGKRK